MKKLALIISVFMIFCGISTSEEVPERYLEIVLNTYEPAKWNHDYGHYDFSIRVSGDEDAAEIISFDAGGVEYSGSVLTFTYGPENGNNSAGMVNVYIDEKPYEPIEELVILEGLTDSDFIVFMDLFKEDFADYDSDADGTAVFRVKDIMFDVYSVDEYQNCAKAMMQLVGMFPGGMGHMMRDYPKKYNELTKASNQN